MAWFWWRSPNLPQSPTYQGYNSGNYDDGIYEGTVDVPIVLPPVLPATTPGLAPLVAFGGILQMSIEPFGVQITSTPLAVYGTLVAAPLINYLGDAVTAPLSQYREVPQ